VLRQLIAMGAVAVDAQASTRCKLTDGSRAVLRAKCRCMLRESVSTPASRKTKKPGAGSAAIKAPIALDGAGLALMRPSRPGAPKWHANTTCPPM
jgi:ATP-dependent DNA helicase RecQ